MKKKSGYRGARKCTHFGSSFWFKEFDEIIKSSASVVVLHFSSSWEKFEGWETLNFNGFEFVGSGIRLGNNDVGVILKE